MYSKLQTELGFRGFEVLGVAFNPEVQETPEVVNTFVTSNKVGFAVGISSPEAVLSYLGVSMAERFMVPQILVIDRKGVVRAQSEVSDSAELQDETYLRSFLESLLQEKNTSGGSLRRR
jgi:hypothetical protein